MGEIALIVGAGAGLSASIARLCADQGMQVLLAARDTDKLSALIEEVGADAYACDASRPEDVDALFDRVVEEAGVPDLVVYNASRRVRGSIVDLDPQEVDLALRVLCYGGFLVGQAAARAMLERGRGSIFFTGASASVKGYPQSAPFAMGKFGLRGLAESMARELQPRNIHVAHFVIDGGIRGERRPDPGDDSLLDPDAIARTYLAVHRQDRSAWTFEVALRPWSETF